MILECGVPFEAARSESHFSQMFHRKFTLPQETNKMANSFFSETGEFVTAGIDSFRRL